MSADEGSMPPPPPPGASDKAPVPMPAPAHAPKAAATFTSFINKNTTGKKFAPKAARRRPAVALPAAATPEPAAAASPPPSTANALPVQPLLQAEPDKDERGEQAATRAQHNQQELLPEAPVQNQGHVTPSVTSEIAAPSPPRRRQRLPWVPVNRPSSDDDTEQARERATAAVDAVDAGQLPLGTAKTRGKRKTAPASAESHTCAQSPPKRTRRPRKAKGKPSLEIVDTIDGDEDVEEIVPRKPRRPTRKKRQAAEGNVQEAQPKQKGRPPRESTPSDAEERTIDPETTFMDGLASRNIRVGKLSNREKQMREIDWAAVRQRRREEDARPIQSKKEQEATDKLLAEAGIHLAAQQDLGPRYHLVDGNIQVVPNSGTVNREADAQREIADYEVVEDRDITSRVTSRSFLKTNKRFPNDFLLPGQGRRWNQESTDLFYQGLRSFGTDFQMISRMFPGSTRRSIKTKFTREEREHSEWVKTALQGRSEMASHWPEFLKAAQMEEANFADTEEIKRQMAEDESHMRELIFAAKEETRQRDLQKVAAGLLDNEDEEPQAGNDENENGREGTKRKIGKDKQVNFQEEQGVEIVGNGED